ncbi:response regulator [candidate division KSB1 bacterium]
MDNAHVLIVDDEHEFVSALVERLEIRNIHAEGVVCGADAIDKIRESEYEIVILDMKMPGMSGMEVLRSILEIRPKTKVILITGYGSSLISDEGMQEGAYASFTKPIDINELLGEIKKAVRSYREN